LDYQAGASTRAKERQILVSVLGQTVTKLEDPVLILEDNVDLIVDGDELAVMRIDAFAQMVTDVDLVALAVPALVTTLTSADLKFSDESVAAIESVCSRRRSQARRLQRLLQKPYYAALTAAQIRHSLVQCGLDPSSIVKSGKIVAGEDDVPRLLDVLEDRLYRPEFDEGTRRADRFSTITSHPAQTTDTAL
jgi:hypothetical protein